MEAEVIPLPAQRHWTTRFGIKFFRYKGLIKRRWWLLLLTVGIGLALEGWLLFSKPVAYQSTGLLLVGERLRIQGEVVKEEADNYYGTQLQLLQNTDIHDQAYRRVALEAPNLTPCKVEVTPTLSPKSSIFSVIGRGANGEYTQRFVDALMDEFLAYKRGAMSRLSDPAERGFSAELERLDQERNQREAQLQAFIKENNMAFWEEQGKSAAVYLSQLKTRRADLGTELQRLQSLSSRELLSRPGPAVASSGAGSAGLGPDFSQQYLLKTQELIEKKAELAERSQVWRPAHPKLMAMKEQVASIERLIKTIEDQHGEATQLKIGAIKTELDVLDSKIAEWEQKSNEASQKDAEYKRLKEAHDRATASYDKLLANLEQLKNATNAGDQGAVQIIKRATPAERVNPGTFKHLFTGLFLGLLVGVGALVVMDRADDRFSSSTEVMEHFSESILGQIPDVNNSRTQSGLPLLQEDDDRYTFAESFRSLRSSLIFMPNQTQLKCVLVTSSIPGEGKSTITSNLGITMALAGTRVLLVDADLRRGDLASLFDTDGRFGLSTILRGEMHWKAVAKSTPYKTLTLIPRGPVTNQSSELLLTSRLPELLEEWKQAFDLVIFNTSPILATDDTASIAPHFDGALMVVRAQFTSGRLVQNSLKALYQRQVNVLGLILNCVDTEMPDYYYYRYPKYYAA